LRRHFSDRCVAATTAARGTFNGLVNTFGAGNIFVIALVQRIDIDLARGSHGLGSSVCLTLALAFACALTFVAIDVGILTFALACAFALASTLRLSMAVAMLMTLVMPLGFAFAVMLVVALGFAVAMAVARSDLCGSVSGILSGSGLRRSACIPSGSALARTLASLAGSVGLGRLRATMPLAVLCARCAAYATHAHEIFRPRIAR
jgi:hypothetical protein